VWEGDVDIEQDMAALRRRVAKLERQMASLMGTLPVPYEDEEDQVPPEVLEMVRRGKMILAIKLYREATGVGLKEAKAFVTSLR
jgi:ribosomal protein L7/L12